MKRYTSKLASVFLSGVMAFGGGHVAMAARGGGGGRGGGGFSGRGGSVGTSYRGASAHQGAGGVSGSSHWNQNTGRAGHTTYNPNTGNVGHTSYNANTGQVNRSVGNVNTGNYGHTGYNRNTGQYNRGYGNAHTGNYYGGTGYRGWSGNHYYYGGRAYARPGWSAGQVNVYSRGFYGYPGWRPYGYGVYGLAPALVGFSSLAFLSAGMLIGTYASGPRTVYVYVVDEGGVKKEYRVDEAGNVISTKIIPQ